MSGMIKAERLQEMKRLYTEYPIEQGAAELRNPAVVNAFHAGT
jgi:hypothetical protein